ncbi:FtsX-like permease family protein [Roseateles saccharophilus]|nr:FtsX-like permease family protein [Roseateles saccharophilus]MDG0831705.1 FtsX-like permease family protein [Roseateles saccharophilus]
MNLLLSSTAWRGAWRQLRGEPGPAALVVLGLALGLALALLAAAMVRDKLWADAGLPEIDRMLTFEWRVRGPGGITTEWFPDVPATPLAAGLREAGAPLGPMTRALNVPLPARATDAAGTQRHARLWTLLADPDIRELFALKALSGDLAAAMASPEGIALTEAGAMKLFGTTQVIGRQLTAAVAMYGEAEPRKVDVTLTVLALIPTPNPHAALEAYDALTGFNAPAAKAFVEQESSWALGAGHLYARLQPGARAEDMGALAQQLLDRQPIPPGLPADFLKGGGKFAYLRAMPMRDRPLQGAGSPLRLLQMGALGAAAASVLAMAVINFINLWSVRTLRRQREIGLRKSLGAGAAALAAQFFVEAWVVALLAGALGLLLAWWATPVVASLMAHEFNAAVLAPAGLALVLGLSVVVAASSALPLALIAQRVQPAASLAGRSHSEGAAGRWLRRGLTLLQFGAAALFTAMTAVVLWQNHHAGALQRGFAVQDRLAFDLPWEIQPAQLRTLLARIKSWPEVEAAAASSDVPGRDFASYYSEFKGVSGQPVNLRTSLEFTPGWLQVYGVRVLAGRLSPDHAAEADAVVLDRSAAQALGFSPPESAVGRTLGTNSQYYGGKPATVAAVIADIRLEDTRSAHVPNVLRPRSEMRGGVISLHSRDPAATRAKLAALLREVLPEESPQVLSVADQQARRIAEDVRLGRLVAVVGALALFMSALGIYALAAHTLRRREREIVLRKLHGAGHGAVARLLAREFGLVVGLACVIALPLAGWLAEAYLGQFVERADMGPFGLGPLAIAAAALVAVTVLAVLRHLFAAFALRPAQALQG